MAVLRELIGLLGRTVEGEEVAAELGDEGKMGLAIEDLIPMGKVNKPFWARGMDVLGYSLNALRLANLDFEDANSPRSTKVVSFQLGKDETERLIAVSHFLFNYCFCVNFVLNL